MQNVIARIISYLFHPLLMPTYAFAWLFSIKAYFSMTIPLEGKLRLILLVFIVTFVFPLLIILFLRSRNIITSLSDLKRNEMTFPYISAIIFNVLAYYLLRNIQISPIFQYFLFGAAVLTILAFIINFFWKISIHMIAIGGLIGMLLGLAFTGIIANFYFIIVPILIAGFIGYSRLQLKYQTPAQTYTGFLLGTFGMIYLALFF